MKQKFSLFYFLFAFLNSLACYGISSISCAATVIITENINTPAAQILSQPEINFLTAATSASPPQLAKTKSSIPFNSKQQTKSLLESGKQLIIENEEDNFVQNSLEIYTQAKLIINETDTLLNILTQDLLFTFGIDQQIHNELIVLQLNGSTNIGLTNLVSVNAYEEDEKRKILLSNTNLDFSNSQLQEEYKNSFFRKLFVIKNLYYLTGAMFLISLFLKILKYILIKQQ